MSIITFTAILEILFLLPLAKSNYTEVDCNNVHLKECACVFDDNSIFKMGCEAYLESSNTYLPNIKAQFVSIKQTFVTWPTIPEVYLNYTIFMDLSYNQIDIIGNISNILNIQYLNLSNNIIARINPDICRLHDMYVLDLSFNLLEVINFEDFLCSTDTDVPNEDDSISNVYSVLEYLILKGNRIKKIHNLDLLYTGMPILGLFDVSKNQLTEINIASVSKSSKNLLKKIFMITEQSDAVKYVANLINQKIKIYTDFSNNSISYVHFNFREIYSVIIDQLPITTNLLLRFVSVDLSSNNIVCNCDLYDDVRFVVHDMNYLIPLNLNFVFLSTVIANKLECNSTIGIKPIFNSVYSRNEDDTIFCKNKSVLLTNGSDLNLSETTTNKQIETTTLDYESLDSISKSNNSKLNLLKSYSKFCFVLAILIIFA